MKKSFLLVLFSIILLSCEVNQSTGQIRLTNISDKEVKNIKIGSTYILYSLAAGKSYDYWFFSDFSGKPSADGFKFDDTKIIACGEDSASDIKYEEGMVVEPKYKVNECGAILFDEGDSGYIISSTGELE